MKLCFYRLKQEEIRNTCMTVLSGAGYTMEAGEPNSSIRATREATYPSPVAIMHLQIRRDKEAVTVSVHSSNLSVLFGNFWHNATDEENFVEQVLISLHEAEKRNRTVMPFFRKAGDAGLYHALSTK